MTTTPNPTERIALIGCDRADLASWCEAHAFPAFRGKQLWQWMYEKGVTSFDAMTNMAKPMREKLSDYYTLERPEIRYDRLSFDGTRKWLLKFDERSEVEVVFIPEEDRGTLCVSSQVGCTLTCKFCHTGTQPWVRNLTAAEIVSQVMLARDMLGDWPSTRTDRRLSNIVFMGMGEPLFNYDAVAKAIAIISDPEGLAISKRRITLSTSGVIPGIERCAEEVGVKLALSLHAVRDDLRNVLVPLNKKYPLTPLLAAVKQYARKTNTRVTFEYVMLNGVNDSDADAKALIKLIRDIPAIVNLIPFNPWPNSGFTCSTSERIAAFGAIIREAGYMSPVRTPRGQDILAACGQLRSESIRERKQHHSEAA